MYAFSHIVEWYLYINGGTAYSEAWLYFDLSNDGE